MALEEYANPNGHKIRLAGAVVVDVRVNCERMPGGTGIEWPELDEHLSIQGLLDGQGSRQALASARRWLAKRGETQG